MRLSLGRFLFLGLCVIQPNDSFQIPSSFWKRRQQQQQTTSSSDSSAKKGKNQQQGKSTTFGTTGGSTDAATPARDDVPPLLSSVFLFHPRLAMNKAHIPLFGQAVLTVVCGLWVARIKKRFIARLLKRSHRLRSEKDGGEHPSPLGRFHFYDQFFNVIIAAIVLSFLFSLFEIDFGPGVKSMFAAGGLGALIFGIASKDLAEQIVGGLVLMGWDVFEEGEQVHLYQLGIEGKVLRIGLADSDIQTYDNMIIKIPNSKIFNQIVSNYSRVKISQVKQTLRFKYSDLKRMPDLLKTIKDEIRLHCPAVITDGSKPFRAHFYAYAEDHVQVVINVHQNIPPGTTDYMDGRQLVNEAIASAVHKAGVEFAIPAVQYKSEGIQPTQGMGFPGKTSL